jgi:2-oxoglutarate ferredoxin oxidoreductase subunit alpha
MATIEAPTKRREVLEQAVVRFCGDSGDGMQITGNQFTNTIALFGNDLSTFPDYPAEIRAPAGTLPGVSGFQIHFSATDIHTPGDAVDVLIAMNPAALKVNLDDLRRGGILIVNADAFRESDLKKAQYAKSPLEDHSLDGYRLFKVELSRLTRAALTELGLDAKSMDRCKNFFALGMCYWLYNRSPEATYRWLDEKFKAKPALAEANRRALRAGYAYCDATEAFQVSYEIPPARLAPGNYRNMSGNTALALGFVAAAERAGLRLFQGSYPITPASDVLHELAMYKEFGVVTFQAEDEIAAIGAALGASFGGNLGLTTTSGPGVALMQETIALGVMAELPLLVINIQRGGPSTGLPTKTEQADLMQAIHGRNGEAPVPVLAASAPSDCFDAVIEAARLAIRHMTPVILLSDGFIANGQEPWRFPNPADLPRIAVKFRTDPVGFEPYKRDDATLARPWVRPGTPGLEHRIGGIEKQDGSGGISYDPENHETMVRLRAAKVERIARDLPPLVVDGPASGDLLVVGWGSTRGTIQQAVNELRARGRSIAHVHLRHLNPLPSDLGAVLKRFKRVVIPEMNMGQLLALVRAKTLVDARGINKIKGKPFRVSELVSAFEEHLS